MTYYQNRGIQFWVDEFDHYHKDNEPAILYRNGDSLWYQHGYLHRLDGPAVDFKNHPKWYIDGKIVDCASNEEFLRIVKLKSFF
jgi:hypothetical protein